MTEICCRACTAPTPSHVRTPHILHASGEATFDELCTAIDAASVFIDPLDYLSSYPNYVRRAKKAVKTARTVDQKEADARFLAFTAAWKVKLQADKVMIEAPTSFSGTEEEAKAAGWAAGEYGWDCPACAAKRMVEDPPGTVHGAGLDDGGPTSEILGAVLTQQVVEHIVGLGAFVVDSADPAAALGTVVRALISYQRHLEAGLTLAASAKKALEAAGEGAR